MGVPKWWAALFRWLMPPEQREAVCGDLEEEFSRRSARDGRSTALRWLRMQVVRSAVPGVRHKIGAVTRGRHRRESRGEVTSMWMQDLGLAARALLKRPGFTGTIVSTLALGVGAITALFGVFRAVFLQPLPLPDAHEIVVIMVEGSACCGPASGLDYLDWVERSRSFDDLAGISPGNFTLTGVGEAERAYVARVTANVFDMLQVQPLVGRTFAAEDRGEASEVVLSHELWMRRYAGADVLGEGLEIEGEVRTIIGVMPERFDVPSPWMGTQRHLLYLPLPDAELQRDRSTQWLPVIARLAEGVDLEGAQSDMDRVMLELAGEYPETNAERKALVFTMHEYLYGSAGGQLALILGAAAMVLLIASANVASLQLARAIGRETELAVRSALGASRGAVVRLLFTESLLLAALGGFLGVAFAHVAIAGITAILPPTMPRADQIELDGLAFAFGLGVSALTAVIFGLLPSFLASRTDLATGVRQGGHRTLAPAKERLRDLFIVGQIAVGLVLANGAVLLVRSYVEVRTQAYGFDTEGVLTLLVSPGGPQYEGIAARESYFAQVYDQVGQVPGVTDVGFISRLPLSGGSNGHVQIEGWEQRTNQDQGPLVEVVSVAGSYFDAMGVPLLRGRLLQPQDSITDAVGVLVNQAMVSEVWPDEDPLGKRFAFDDGPPWLTVVGVVGDVRQWGVEDEVLAQAYFPYARGWSTGGYVTVRFEGDPTVVAPAFRRAVLSVDPTLPPGTVIGMDERLERRFAQRRFYTSLIGFFAVAALLLAAAGVYGTVAYFVARRTRELGIRIVLGAAGPGILGLVIRRGVRLALAGIALGLGGVWASLRIAEGLVYGVAPIDPISLGVGALLLGGVAVLASALPAARAVRVQPVIALRAE